MSLDAGRLPDARLPPNISGKMFEQRSYGTDPATGLIDYAVVREIARKSPARWCWWPAIPPTRGGSTSRPCGRSRTRSAPRSWWTWRTSPAVAGKVFTGDFDPVPHAHIVTTTTHKSLRGPRGGMVLCQPELAGAVDRGCPLVLGGPLPNVMGSHVALAEARQPSFRDYAQRIVANAQALSDGLIRRGTRLVTGGTDNHLVLIDVGGYGLTGRQAEQALLDAAS